MSNYEKLRGIDVSEWAEKKGKFNYLSWAHAVDQLGKAFPEATWEVREWDGMPFIAWGKGGFVCVTVTVGEVSKTQWHPILNHQNKPIADPDPFQVNTAIQRCLAKAIGLHGLGIGLYCGEDLLQYDGEGGGGNSQPDASQGATGQSNEDKARALMADLKITNKHVVEYMEMKSKGKVSQISDFGEATWKWLAEDGNMGLVVDWHNSRVPF